MATGTYKDSEGDISYLKKQLAVARNEIHNLRCEKRDIYH
jgi:hypothetical protein